MRHSLILTHKEEKHGTAGRLTYYPVHVAIRACPQAYYLSKQSCLQIDSAFKDFPTNSQHFSFLFMAFFLFNKIGYKLLQTLQVHIWWFVYLTARILRSAKHKASLRREHIPHSSFLLLIFTCTRFNASY